MDSAANGYIHGFMHGVTHGKEEKNDLTDPPWSSNRSLSWGDFRCNKGTIPIVETNINFRIFHKKWVASSIHNIYFLYLKWGSCFVASSQANITKLVSVEPLCRKKKTHVNTYIFYILRAFSFRTYKTKSTNSFLDSWRHSSSKCHYIPVEDIMSCDASSKICENCHLCWLCDNPIIIHPETQTKQHCII